MTVMLLTMMMMMMMVMVKSRRTPGIYGKVMLVEYLSVIPFPRGRYFYTDVGPSVSDSAKKSNNWLLPVGRLKVPWAGRSAHTHPHSHTHTRSRTHTHTHTHTHVHTLTTTLTHLYAYTHARPHSHTYAHTHHPLTHIHTHS